MTSLQVQYNLVYKYPRGKNIRVLVLVPTPGALCWV